jgi:hypothetical protein
MRSVAELIFRTKQELANARLWLNPPSISVELPAPHHRLPDPTSFVDRIKRTQFSTEVLRLADLALEHRFVLPGGILDAGARIEWRRDYQTLITSEAKYFRRIPYLDFARTGNTRAIWELNRHQHLVVLAQASILDGQIEYVNEIEAEIRSWMNDNPYMRGINWTSALEVAFRALSWIWVYHLAGRSLSADVRRIILVGLYQHGCYLRHNLSIYASPNTHLLGEAVALHALGTLFPEFSSAADWRSHGAVIMRCQMDAQVREDGSHFEQSSYYHLYALDLFLFHQILEQTDDHYRSKLWLMADYLDTLMGRSRRLPLIGDDDGGRVFHPYGPPEGFGRATIATCAKVLGESRWAYEPVDLYEQAVWWTGAAVFEEPAPVPSSVPSRLFAVSGTASLRATDLEVLVDAGPFGTGTGGHSHSDTLSVIARAGSEELLVDCGTFTYMADSALREWFRSSAAHNTIRIDGLNQAVAQGPFRWAAKPDVAVVDWVSDSRSDLLDAVCRYKSGAALVHRRRVLLLKAHDGILSDTLVIIDVIEGPPGKHLVEQIWHPGEPLKRMTSTQVQIGSRATLSVPKTAQLTMIENWRSRKFGEHERITSIAVRHQTFLPVTMCAALTLSQGCGGIHVWGEINATDAVVRVAPGVELSVRIHGAARNAYDLRKTVK